MTNGDKKIPKKAQKGFTTSENPRAGSNSSRDRMHKMVSNVVSPWWVGAGSRLKNASKAQWKSVKEDLPLMNPFGFIGKLFEE
tara:strand:- start:4747 stop:4995 length:249 start_codon:yes stop_codon:yes gene_type:complete